jgi:hypothetical protein
VKLSAASTSAVTVNYATANGTALSGSGSDYTAANGTLTFAVGETSKTFTVAVTGDTTFETNETFTVGLSGASTNVTLGTSTVTATITNDDTNAAPTITVTPATANAQVGQQNSLGLDYTLADADNGILTATITPGNGQVRLTDATNLLTFGTGTVQGAFANTLTVSGTIANLNTVLDSLAYQTGLTTGGADTVTVAVSDGTNTTTKAVTLNVGNSLVLTSSNDSLVGSSGPDLISGSQANYVSTDTINGGDGVDTLSLTAVTGLQTTTANVTNVEILELASAADILADNNVTVVNGAYVSTLTNINHTFTVAQGEHIATYSTLANNTVVKLINNEDAADTVGGVTLTRTSATNIGQSDTLGLTLQADNNGANNAWTITALAVDGIDTLNLVSQQTSGGTTATSPNVISAITNSITGSKIVASGATGLTITKLDADSAGYQIVDGSLMTGALGINVSDTAGHTIGSGLNLTGGSGADQLGGSNKADVLTGNADADTLTGGAGADSIVLTEGTAAVDKVVQANGASIVKTGGTAVALTNFASGQTIIFANGVDVITGFEAGATKDTIDVTTEGVAITGIGVDPGAMTADKTIFLSGAYVAETGTFTIAADGVGLDTLVVDTTDDADQDLTTADTWVVLVGVGSASLHANNFV